MKNYQLICVLSSEDDINVLKEKIVSFLQQEEGIFIDSFRKKSKNYLFIVNFQINPEKLSDFEKKIKSEKQVLKYMIVLRKDKENKTISSSKTEDSGKQKEEKVKIEEIEKKLEEILK